MKKKFKSNTMSSNMTGRKKQNFPYELTIGMIVKNDVERLRTCLETMQPLRDAIKCQLIITDTGSTDGTREVAEEYADILLDFEWIDDFAAARNSGIEHAEGRWFAFFDSDHEFDESLMDMVRFLKSKESYERDAATVTTRDYIGDEGSYQYSDNGKYLLFNFQDGKRFFKHRIHESIDVDSFNSGATSVIIHHWGYVGKLDQAKADRNLPLLKKYIEESPMELKNYIQIAAELQNDYNEAKIYLSKGIEVAKTLIANGKTDQLEEGCLCNLRLQLCRVCYLSKDWNLFDETLKEVEGLFPNTILELEYWGHRLHGACHRNIRNDIVPSFLQFKKLHFALEKKPDLIYINTGHFVCTTSHYYSTQENVVLDRIVQLDLQLQLGDIAETATGYTNQAVNGDYHYIYSFFVYAGDLKCFSLLLKVYHFTMENGSEAEKKACLKHLANLFRTFEGEDYENLLKTFSKESPSTLLAPYLYEAVGFDLSACDKEVVNYLEKDSVYDNLGYKSLFYAYMSTGKDTFGFIKNSSIPFLLDCLGFYLKQKSNSLERIISMLSSEDASFSTWKEEKLWAYMGRKTLLTLLEEEKGSTQEKMSLCYGSGKLFHSFMKKMYQPEAIESDEIGLIPHEELCGYFSYEALSLKESGDQVSFVRKLKELLTTYPEYKQVILFYLEELKKGYVKVAPISKEQDGIALKVKATVKQLIQGGKLLEAKMILEKYKLINPNDPELTDLAQQCK